MGKNIKDASLKRNNGLGMVDYAIYIVLIGLIIVYAILSPNFLTTRNIFGMLLNGNHLLILSIGMGFVLLTGLIDLSVGSIAYVSVVIAGTIMRDHAISPLAGLLICLLVGMGLGLINGILIVKLKLNGILVTLAMMIGLRGVGHQITKSLIIELDETLKLAITHTVGGIPIMVILVIVFIIIAQIVLSQTIFGKYVTAIGCNEKAAKNLGINTDFIKIIIMLISGILAAMAGFYSSANLGTCLQTMGDGWEFQAISIVVLGGVSLSGGVGKICPGVLVGFLVMVIIENGLALLGTTFYLLPIIRGLVIFMAMFADSLRIKRSQKLSY
ncbi:MAG: ABC transporter permease [Atribacterota bacterium]|nr:ABC transporter permease [Atribacterota bacterium]